MSGFGGLPPSLPLTEQEVRLYEKQIFHPFSPAFMARRSRNATHPQEDQQMKKETSPPQRFAHRGFDAKKAEEMNSRDTAVNTHHESGEQSLC